MNIERARSVLGVWAPMGLGLFIIATSINFFFTAQLEDSPATGDLESWRFVCSAGAFFIGGVLILSTYGRYTKTKEARRESTDRPASTATPTPTPDEESDDDRERHKDET
jgi:hypothetical protein